MPGFFLVNFNFNIHSVHKTSAILAPLKKGGRGGGSDPCQDFSGEFEQSFGRWQLKNWRREGKKSIQDESHYILKTDNNKPDGQHQAELVQLFKEV